MLINKTELEHFCKNKAEQNDKATNSCALRNFLQHNYCISTAPLTVICLIYLLSDATVLL